MLTIEQARAYLASMGITLPDEVLVPLVETINSINECLNEHYSPAVANMIRLYLLGLHGAVSGDKYVTSEHAPSGASRSYAYKALKDRYKSLYDLLKLWDKFGCATDLIPPDPTAQAKAGLWVSRGGCYCGSK